MARQTEDRTEIISQRNEREQKLNAWRKRSPFSPYWIDWSLLRRSIEELPPHSRGWLLDLGCSEGPYRTLFEERVERYIGLEYPPAILEKRPDLWDVLYIAKRTIEVFGDGTSLPFADGSFDTVLATEVLEHLPTPDLAVAEAARILKPGGKLLVTVPFCQPLHELPGDYYRFTPASLEKMVRDVGLVPVEIKPRGNYALAVGAVSAQFLSRWLATSVRLPDGSVKLSRWRNLVFMPLFALVQVFFHLASKVTSDTTFCLGYTVIAKKPGGTEQPPEQA